LRQSNSRAEPAAEAPLEREGMVVARIEFFRPGAQESCLARDGVRLAPASPPFGIDPGTWSETLIGARAGEQRELELEFPANFPVEEARGEKGRVRVRIDEVLRIVPPTDEELQRIFGATDDSSLRAAIRARMEKAKQEHEEQ